MLMPHSVLRRILPVLGVLLVIALPLDAAATSSSTSKSSSSSSSNSSSSSSTSDGIENQAVTQGYSSDGTLQKGMLVRLDPKDSKKVDALTLETVAQMQGVVVAANDAAVTLSGGNSGQVFVATYGAFSVLVSNQNGPVKAGDYITVSSLAGIGMKADTTEAVVLGKALEAFTGSGNVQGTAKLKEDNGSSVNVSIGLIQVSISISHNPFLQQGDRALPPFLKKISETVAGKSVSAIRVYVALSVLLVGTLLAGGVLYSGIRGGLIAIGRNPLAKKRVVGGIFRVVIAGLVIFLVSIFGVYLLLRL